MTTTIAPCPFRARAGDTDEPRVIDGHAGIQGRWYAVWCPACGARGPRAFVNDHGEETEKLAVILWGRRAG